MIATLHDRDHAGTALRLFWPTRASYIMQSEGALGTVSKKEEPASAGRVMSRFASSSLLAVFLGSLLPSFAVAQPPREQIELSNHARYSGLIESEDSNWLTLIRIETPRGRPTHLVIQPFDRNQIVSITRLDDAERAELQKQIDEFRNRATIEAARMEAVRLGTAAAEGRTYRHYQGRWFTLDSTADEQNTRRVVVRAEQIFAAYRQILLPPTRDPQAGAPGAPDPVRPLRLILLGSLHEYQAVLVKLGVTARFQNPACYIEDKNTVVIGSDLTRLSAAMGQLEAQNVRLRRELRELEQRLAERLRSMGDELRKSGMSNGDVGRELTKVRGQFKQQVDKKNEELRQSDAQIERLFKQAAGQMLVRLYHEAFHAYVRNWVFPRPQYDIPSWLDEGLAVLFEGGLLEGDKLRVDAPNPVVLKKLKADMAGPDPLALSDLLAAGQGNFHIAAAAQPEAADRYYVNAWGLAYYLTFEQRLLTGPALEKYLRSENARLAPAVRLRLLTGLPLGQFEAKWRRYISEL